MELFGISILIGFFYAVPLGLTSTAIVNSAISQRKSPFIRWIAIVVAIDIAGSCVGMKLEFIRDIMKEYSLEIIKILLVGILLLAAAFIFSPGRAQDDYMRPYVFARQCILSFFVTMTVTPLLVSYFVTHDYHLVSRLMKLVFMTGLVVSEIATWCLLILLARRVPRNMPTDRLTIVYGILILAVIGWLIWEGFIR